MLQFTVPQFIDVEDKIIGPITVRQFLIILTGCIFMGISYKLFDFSLFLTISIIIFIISVVFGFVKVNGMPFHFFVLNFVQTGKRPNLRIWNNELTVVVEVEENEHPAKEKFIPPPKLISSSRLTELALIVDTKGAYRGEQIPDYNRRISKTNEIDINKLNSMTK